jgi:hypothetical protein
MSCGLLGLFSLQGFSVVGLLFVMLLMPGTRPWSEAWVSSANMMNNAELRMVWKKSHCCQDWMHVLHEVHF